MNSSPDISPNQNWYKDIAEEANRNKKIIHQYFDIDFTRAVVQKVIVYLNNYYFRPRFVGFDKMPERNQPAVPLIFASNHSGMAFPWDGIILASGLYEMFDYGPKSVRPLASPMLSESILMNPYLYDNLWKIVGSVDASFLNFETMMLQKEHNLLIYPEGVPGIAKGFNRRYQLQRFSSSFITMSIKYQTDIVPILTVNGEYINPYAYKSTWLNRLVNKIGIPFFPVGFISLLLPFQPWIFYMGFPAKLTYVLGESIKPYEMTSKSIESLSYEELLEIKENVQTEMQSQLTKAVEAYGKRPYELGEFTATTFRNLSKLPYSMPFGWPLLFKHFSNLWRKNKIDEKPLRIGYFSWIKTIFQSPKQLFFYIPVLGWIPLLIRGIRRRSKHQPPR
jgi:1-acyl-sn-glycerol-3-phosphate acyltransferase